MEPHWPVAQLLLESRLLCVLLAHSTCASRSIPPQGQVRRCDLAAGSQVAAGTVPSMCAVWLLQVPKPTGKRRKCWVRELESSSGLLGTTGWLGAQEEAGRAGGAEQGARGSRPGLRASASPGCGAGGTLQEPSSSSCLQFRAVLV